MKKKSIININKTVVRRALVLTIVIFAIGLIFKLVDKSMATWHYNYLIDKRDELTPFKEHSPIAAEGWNRYNNGAKDQLVGVAIGWPLIALKIVIYGITIYSLLKMLKTCKGKENKFLTFMWLFIRLAIGLVIGEAITVWLTERNDVDHSPRTIYSYISPAISILLAIGMSVYFGKSNNKLKIES